MSSGDGMIGVIGVIGSLGAEERDRGVKRKGRTESRLRAVTVMGAKKR